jgi:hypothetical protein
MLKHTLSRGLVIFLVVLAASLVAAHATVTGEFRVAIDVNQTLSYAFTPTANGTVVFSATFKPIGSKLALKLFRSDKSEPIAHITGENPIQLSIAIDRASPNLGYLATIQNLSDRTLSGFVEITYPKANCKEFASEYLLDLRYVVENVPMQEEQCAVMHKTLRSLPEKLRSGLEKIIAFPQDPEVAGQYIASTIRIFGDLQGAQLARVFFHEVGHHIQFAHFTSAQQDAWLDLNKRSGSDSEHFARLYGRTNQFEDFATVFEAYTGSTSESLSVAQTRHARGKSIYLEKIRFVASLFSHERNGSQRTYIYKTESLFGDARILRASVILGSDNLPQIPALPDWEEF